MTREWLLLLYFLPAGGADARVRAWRRLQRLGAVLLNNSAYALPLSPESREDFEWIRNEITAAGGRALVLVARAPDQATGDEIVAAFRAARRQEFEAVIATAAKLLRRTAGRLPDTARRQLTQQTRRLRERFEEARRLDFFGTPEQDAAAASLAELDRHTGRSRTMPASTTDVKAAEFKGKIWRTRPRPGVDRMSSAWLIRRYIDPGARFVFGEAGDQPNAIPFDTFEADFGHHGSHCTFETFCQRFGIDDPAIQHIGRIVHDLDLKESTYREAETATIGGLIEGLRQAHSDDAALLQAGVELFEALYRSVLQTSAAAAPSRSRTAPNRRAAAATRQRKRGDRRQ